MLKKERGKEAKARARGGFPLFLGGRSVLTSKVALLTIQIGMFTHVIREEFIERRIGFVGSRWSGERRNIDNETGSDCRSHYSHDGEVKSHTWSLGWLGLGCFLVSGWA